jgi:hypothetical protein
MLNIHIYKKSYQVPEEWNELTGKQLVQLAPYLGKSDLSKADKLEMLRVLLGMTRRSFISWGYLPRWISDSLFWKKIEVLLFLERSLYLVDFLFKDNLLTKQLLPVLFCPKLFFGPSDNFENLRMDEFCFSEFWFLNFKETGSRDALVNLAATLYRPAKRKYDKLNNPDGDIRVAFNENLIKAYAKDLLKIPNATLEAILIWYMGCRNNLVKLFPKVFSGKNGDGENFGLFSLITGVAEDGVMGDFDKVNAKHVHTVLLRLTELIIRAEKMEADLQANK